MKTYVELKNDNRKFDTIEDAIQEADSYDACWNNRFDCGGYEDRD